MAKPHNSKPPQYGIIEKWQRPDKSGLQKAPPTYAGLLCREILAENARAKAAVDAKRKGNYYGRGK